MKPAFLRWGGLFAATALCIVLVFALHVPQAYSALFVRQAEIRDLQRKNAELSQQNEQKRSRIRELEDNGAIQELEIRERTKKLRKGETSFILQDHQPPAK